MKQHKTSQLLCGILLTTVILNATPGKSFAQISVDGGPQVKEAVLFSFALRVTWPDSGGAKLYALYVESE